MSPHDPAPTRRRSPITARTWAAAIALRAAVRLTGWLINARHLTVRDDGGVRRHTPTPRGQTPDDPAGLPGDLVRARADIAHTQHVLDGALRDIALTDDGRWVDRSHLEAVLATQRAHLAHLEHLHAHQLQARRL